MEAYYLISCDALGLHNCYVEPTCLGLIHISLILDVIFMLNLVLDGYRTSISEFKYAGGFLFSSSL